MKRLLGSAALLLALVVVGFGALQTGEVVQGPVPAAVSESSVQTSAPPWNVPFVPDEFVPEPFEAGSHYDRPPSTSCMTRGSMRICDMGNGRISSSSP